MSTVRLDTVRPWSVRRPKGLAPEGLSTAEGGFGVVSKLSEIVITLTPKQYRVVADLKTQKRRPVSRRRCINSQSPTSNHSTRNITTRPGRSGPTSIFGASIRIRQAGAARGLRSARPTSNRLGDAV